MIRTPAAGAAAAGSSAGDQQPVQPDPESGQPARIRNAGNSDQDNRHGSGTLVAVIRTPAPGAAAAGSSAGDRRPCSRIRSQDNRHGSGTLVAVIRTPAPGAAAAGSSAGDRRPVRPDPEPGTGDQQRDLSADGVQQDPLPEIGSHAAGSGARTTGTDPERW